VDHLKNLPLDRFAMLTRYISLFIVQWRLQFSETFSGGPFGPRCEKLV